MCIIFFTALVKKKKNGNAYDEIGKGTPSSMAMTAVSGRPMKLTRTETSSTTLESLIVSLT